MSAIVLGFAGKKRSGKSTLSRKVAEALNWPYVSCGNHVRAVANQRGLGDSLQALQDIGASLVDEDREQFCRAVLDQVEWEPGQPLVIDGIRHVEVIEVLREMVKPSVLRVIYIEVNEDTREARLSNDGINDRQQLERVESHSTEIQVKTVLPKIADLIVDGNQPVDTLVTEIFNWVRQIGDVVDETTV